MIESTSAIRPLRKVNFRHPDIVEAELDGVVKESLPDEDWYHRLVVFDDELMITHLVDKQLERLDEVPPLFHIPCVSWLVEIAKNVGVKQERHEILDCLRVDLNFAEHIYTEAEVIRQGNLYTINHPFKRATHTIDVDLRGRWPLSNLRRTVQGAIFGYENAAEILRGRIGKECYLQVPDLEDGVKCKIALGGMLSENGAYEPAFKVVPYGNHTVLTRPMRKEVTTIELER